MLLMHCCFSGLEIIHGTVIYVIFQPIERESKKSGDMKVFHPFSLFLALSYYLFSCNCKVNILQYIVDDVKMPKNNFQHTTYISENNMGKILNFVISIFEIKKMAKSIAIEKIQILLAHSECLQPSAKAVTYN